MKRNRTPIAAALCCMALASAPAVFAAGDTADRTGSMNRSGSSMSGSGYGHTSSMDSQTVRQVQQALADKGHNPGQIDGVMGPRTRAALQSYQRQNNLSGASGLDQQTLDSLGVQASSSMSSGSMATGRSDSGSSAGASGATTGGTGGGTMGSATGSKVPNPTSSSSADQGTASDGAANSPYPTPESRAGSSAGGTGATTGGAGGAMRNPSPSGSNASQGTASDGGPTSNNPSGSSPARSGTSGGAGSR